MSARAEPGADFVAVWTAWGVMSARAEPGLGAARSNAMTRRDRTTAMDGPGALAVATVFWAVTALSLAYWAANVLALLTGTR